MHYGLYYPQKRREPLEFYSSLKRERNQEKIENKCELRYIDEFMACVNRCYTPCNQWQYEVTGEEDGQGWISTTPANHNNTAFTAADFFHWRRRSDKLKRGADDQNATHVSFEYMARNGMMVVEEISRYSASTFISNVGGMMGLVAGASALSLCQVVEFIVQLCVKRIASYKAHSYTLS